MKRNLTNFVERFSEDYFEDGPKTGISLYKNFRWMPKRTIPMAAELVLLYPGKSILDFGCAKGFLVHALRHYYKVEAYGFDISCYAIKNCKPEARFYCFGPDRIRRIPAVDVVFIKDTLEHISYHVIDRLLKALACCEEALFIVPFGDDQRYRIAEYEKDATHIIAENEAWWQDRFEAAGFKLKHFSYYMPNFKENWKIYPKGNGYYQLYGVGKCGLSKSISKIVAPSQVTSTSI